MLHAAVNHAALGWQHARRANEQRRTERALLEFEERFRLLADAMPEVLWITDLNPERVVYTSPSFERIWGLSVQDLYKNPRLWTETIHPDDRARLRDVQPLDRGRDRRLCRC